MSEGKSAAKKLKIAYKDVERDYVEGEDIKTEVITADIQERIVKQIEVEYNLCFDFNEAKRLINLTRLKLYNNQRRIPEAVGDPLMFTVFNTIHAALWDDRLMQTWEGNELGDDEIEDNLNALSAYDYDLMGKAEMDYYWNWDAEFFGRGLVLMMDFDREKMVPVPQLIDAATFIRDPKAKSVNGYGLKHEGAMRFGGYPVGATYWQLKEHPAYFNLKQLRKDREIHKSLQDEATEARNEAQNRDEFWQKEEELNKHDNYEFQLMNWFTYIKGSPYLVTLGNRRTTIIRLTDLSKYDGWPIIDRTLYPIPNDWDGVSLPDITEDKQRARALLMNLGLKSAKSDAMPQYLFDTDRITNKNDLNWKHDKFIGIHGPTNNAMEPVQKSTVHQYVNLIMDMLDQATQRATATPEIQQGVPSDDKRTLGEVNLVSSKVDTRYSMSAKLYGISDANFWRQWYRQYKMHFKNKIDTKVVRIAGALAPSWRPLTRENIISQVDPDVRIESKVISEAKRQREQQAYSVFAGLALQDPANNRRYLMRHYGELLGMKREQLDMVFPKTVDELQADDENIVINQWKEGQESPPVNVYEDHQTHIYAHAKANNNPARLVHIQAHKEAMKVKRNNPELFPPEMSPISKPVTDQRAGVQNRPAPTTPTT